MPRKTAADCICPAPDGWGFNEAAARCRGKRRPGPRRERVQGASMRPRPDAAENSGRESRAVSMCQASMRPRPDAAENAACTSSCTHATRGFNEAAARCRGKRDRGGPDEGAGRGASMRPRPDAAENAGSSARGCAWSVASMRPRPDAAENAALGRGFDAPRAASMRPRPDAAENVSRSGSSAKSTKLQ